MEDHFAACSNCATGRDGSPPAPIDHTHVFNLLNQSDEVKELLRYMPLGKRPIAWSALWISLGLVLITPAIVGQLEHTAAVGLIMLGAMPLGMGVYDLLKLWASPLMRLPAIVLYKSKRLYGGGELVGGGTILAVCIEMQNGQTHDYRISLRLFEKIQKRDRGIAYIRGDQMLDFKKVTFPET